MVHILEITPSDINILDEKQLTDLLLRLLGMEAHKFGIPKSSISGSLETKASDGGEDARIKWEGGIEKTDWIPNRFTLFQCKAEDMPASECENEILSKNELKPRIKNLFENNGSYVLFFTKECNQFMKDEREKAFRKSLENSGVVYHETADIRIYDASSISKWVNEYLPVIIKVCNWTGRQLPKSFHTWDEWAEYPDSETNYVRDEILSSHISQLREHFTGAKKVARVVGLSGLGKTRLALEVFRPSNPSQNDSLSQTIADEIIYVDMSDGAEGLQGLVQQWRTLNLSGTLVVDNCDLELHQRLRKEIEHPKSKMNLLTLDYNPETNGDENIIQLQPASKKVIEGIIRQSYPSLRDIDIKRVIEFADGFPQIAVMLANARLNDAPDIGNLKDNVLIDKLIWGRRPKNEDAHKVISSCSLFTHLGFYDDVIHQSYFVAKNVCGVDQSDFRRHAIDFIEHGILDRRNRFVRVVPIPLAMRLAADWWKRWDPAKAKELILGEMPEGMSEALCNQISKLHYVHEARQLTKELCGERGPFGQAEVLNSDRGSRLFRSLVEVNPIDTAFALERAFGSWNKQQLYQIKGGRRNLVWALEKLCFWEDTFPIAARILFLFAVSENETWGNNSTNQLYQLFHYVLSGTQAPPELRLRVLDEFLNYDDLDYKKIAVEALGHSLHASHFVRNTGAEIQGSRAPLEEWKPKIWQEVFDYWTESLKRLIPFIIVDDELGALARKQITNNMRGLVETGRLEDIESALKSCIESDIFWLEAYNEIETIIRVDKCKLPSRGHEKLKEWLELLEPKTFVQRWKSIVSNPSYGLLLEEDEEYNDKNHRLVTLFAKECSQNHQELLDNLRVAFVGQQKEGYDFGYVFGQNTSIEYEFIHKSLDTIKIIPSENVDSSVLCGFIRAIQPRNPKLVKEILDTVAKDEDLYIHTLNLTCSIEPTKEDLNRIIKLVNAKKISPNDLRIFAIGSVLQHLLPENVITFVEDILNLGEEGVLPALQILYMYTFKDEEKFYSCSSELQKIVQFPGILSKIGLSTNTMDKYNYSEVVSKLLISKNENNSLAINISKDFISTCCHEKFIFTLDFELDKILSILLTRYVDIIWPFFSEILLSNDSKQYYLKLYLKPDNKSKYYSEGIFGKIREDIIVEWCITNSEKAPAIVAELIPLFVEQDNGCSFGPIAKYLLYTFGDKKDVQSALDSNIWSFSSFGSRIPYYEKQIEALKEMEYGKNPSLDSWIQKMVKKLEKRIECEKGREGEYELGIF